MNEIYTPVPVNSRLIRAVLKNNHGWVERILAAGADVRCRDRHGRSLASLLAKASRGLLEVLARHGLDPSDPRFWTAHNRRSEFARWEALYPCGSPDDFRERDFDTPLATMVRAGEVNCNDLRRLVDAGFRPEANAHDALAAIISHQDHDESAFMLKVLLEKVAEGREQVLNHALACALCSDNFRAARFLRNQGARLGEAGIELCDTSERLDFFVEEPGLDVRAAVNRVIVRAYNQDFCMLSRAIRRDDVELAAKMLALGADPDLHIDSKCSMLYVPTPREYADRWLIERPEVYAWFQNLMRTGLHTKAAR